MSACQHRNFKADAEVTRILNGIDEADGGELVAFVAEMRVACADCGAAFGWRGVPCGITQNGHPTRNATGDTLVAWLLSPSELALAEPPAGMTAP